MSKIFILVIFMLVVAACGEEAKKTGFGEAASKIEPFLAPVVEKISGGEAFSGAGAEVRDLIVNYNKAVVETQINMDKLKKLKALATKDEYTRMFASLEKDRTEGKIMSCTLKALVFKDISLDKDNGSVDTSEEWFFEDRELKSGNKLSKLKDMDYEVRYKVARTAAGWVVAGIEIRKAMEYIPPRGEPARVRALPHNTGVNGGDK